ncbi:MAG: AAA family ATPase [Chloroflexota bacterium]|nr:AAA family ATPase [Chloroflexota bacterium]
MRLRAVELHGYKSFAARTALQFDAPVTAIVGPNGSGKSNVMDALRWAIGAGSGRTLRTKRAEDVVFSGGRDRAPSGFAEVRVQLDNADQWLGLDAAEVEIVRRVHRDGQSEVRVNGRTARLRDVQDLFRSSGLGAGGFALMSQGLVDEMLRLRPHERRQAIEEVGGVRQHRHQMEESRRRRQRAQEHLSRARLLRDELAPRLKTLERSARRARRLADLQGQLGEAQRDYFRVAAAEVEAQILRRHQAANSAAIARAGTEQRQEAATDALAVVERETAVARRTVETAAEAIRTARSELRSLEHQQELDQQQRSWLSREVEALSTQLPTSRHDSATPDLESARRALSDADRELDAARSERANMERERTRVLTQHERSLAEIADIRTRATRLARRWKATAEYLSQSNRDERIASEAYEGAQTALQRAEADARDAQRQLLEVREAQESRAAERGKLERRVADVERQLAVLEQNDQASDNLRSLVRSTIEDPIRAEAIFGELMDAELHHDLDAAIASVCESLEADAGRVTALVRTQAQELIASMLGDVEFVDDIEAARAVAEAGRTAVTASGIIVRPDGVVQAGGSRPGLRRQQEHLSELRSERTRLTAELQELAEADSEQREVEVLERARLDAEARVESLRVAVDERRIAHEEVLRRRATSLAQQRSDGRESQTLRTGLRQARQAERKSAQLLSDSSPDTSTDISRLERERDRCAVELAEARAQAAAHDRARADRARLFSLRRELEAVEAAIREREPLLEVAQATASDTGTHQLATEHLEILEQRRATAARELEQAQQTRLAAERRDVEASAALRESESARARLAAEAASEGISIHAAGASSQPIMQLNGGNGAAGHIRNGSTGESHLGGVAVAVADPPVAVLKQAVDEIQAKLQRLGPVDPGSVQEYASEQERWQQMETQISDLESTESALRQAEHDLETMIERKFREACNQVDRAFRHYFQLMFRGGQAELVLTDDSSTEGEDSESATERGSLGVDIRAQPPGKRVSTLGLLSGGERALTAIALLFALLEVRPAPFCILDEVDAALDEANVERFVTALKERAGQTQFVIITHNRRTIEQADGIYGVTMGAAGVSRLLSVRLDQIPQTNS